jgi:hypothetical protein
MCYDRGMSDPILELRKVLSGIDRCEHDADDGWWETSAAAEFGRAKLAEVEALFRRFLEERV